jgi:predicted dienelactone hydrolase
MTPGRLALLLLLGAPLTLQAQQPAPSFRYPVAGMQRRAWRDSARPAWTGEGARPLTTLIWYPAGATSAPDSLRIGAPDAPLFLSGIVATGAPFADAERHPLILISHGTGGSALQLAWLGTALARQGYVVAAVNHHGNTGAEPAYDPRGFLLWWERARDLSAVLDRVLSDSSLAVHIDPRRIGALGFSIGGYTVLALAGARVDLAQFDRFCASPARDATCGSQAEMPEAGAAFDRLRQSDTSVQRSLAAAGESYRDPRIGAVVAIAPAVVQALTERSLSEVSVPLLVVAGDSDATAPAATNARVAAARVPRARLQIEAGVRHYTFLSVCTARGQEVLSQLCQDGAGVNRGMVHTRVAAATAAFLDQVMTPGH